MIIETKNCIDCKKEFSIEDADKPFYDRLGMSLPVQCPLCRLRQLFAFWIFGRFRKTISALSGKTIITVFSESVPFQLYDRTEWVGDGWDPLMYGRVYDPSKPFFEQYQNLQKSVPHPHQGGVGNTNSEWSDDVWYSRNCYLCRSLMNCEFCSYGYRIFDCKNSTDLVYCFKTEFSYDCLYCFNCYQVRHSFNSRDCVDSMFLYDCRNVQNSFMCWNLRNKQYHILNQPYSKEEYQNKLKEFDTRSWKSIQKLKSEFEEILKEKAVHRQNLNVNVTNSTGNLLNDDKNCENCTFLDYSENCRHCWRGLRNKDVIDSVGTIAEKGALQVNPVGMYETVGTISSSNCRYSYYLEYCEDCEYCFGCVSLRKKKYCILNKQYTEEQYKELIARMKVDMEKRGEWGRFFPYPLAPSGYNLSVGNIFFPSSKNEIIALGGRWEEIHDTTQEGMNEDEIPDRIDEVSPDISKKPIICPITKWKFNIAPHELEFCKQYGIPIPRNHFDYRALERFKRLALLTTPRIGVCMFCKKNITHFYPPEFGYKKIACVECYQAEIV